MITLAWGEDTYLLAAEEQRMVAELVDESWRSVNLGVYDGGSTPASTVVNSARTAPFFGNRLVVVRDCPWFSPARGKGDGEEAAPVGDAKPIVELLEQGLPEGCHLLLLVPKKIHKGMTTSKAAEAAGKAGRARVIEFPAPDRYHTERTEAWVVEQARSVGGGIDREAAKVLVGRLGQDKYLLDQELKKLSAYGSGRQVTAADVLLLSPPGESDVFELLEAVAKKQTERAVLHMRWLLVHEPHPLKILAAMATIVRTWLGEKALLEARRAPDDIARELKRHPFVVKKDLELIKRWSAAKLLEAAGLISEAESALKGSGLPDLLVMERLLAKLAAL